MGDYADNCSNVNVNGTRNVVPLALMIQMIDQRINSVVCVVELRESKEIT